MTNGRPETVQGTVGEEPGLAEPRSSSTLWLTVHEAADRARCGERSIYNAVRSGKLRAARLGGRRELRFLAEWIDAWLLESTTPVVLTVTVR
jgi:excisionase family DNA binding protein